jgi:hypothetical protein
VLVFALPACRACGTAEGPSDGGAENASSLDGEARAPAVDGGRHAAQGPNPSVAAAWLDAAAPDPACSGDKLALETVLASPACATSSGVAKALRAAVEASPGVRADGATGVLRQEASVEGGLVTVALVNGASTALALPLSWHPKLPAFTALAEDEHHALYELAPPALSSGRADAGDGARFARIVLPPRGRATAKVAIDPVIVRRVDAACPGEGCPARLPRGRYVLHVGQLLCDVEAGPPARVDWEMR